MVATLDLRSAPVISFNRMKPEHKIAVRCRAVILHEGKLLVVKHRPESAWYALPGGHLEWGEGVQACLVREIEEELGVRPELGRLVYINTFVDAVSMTHSVEFFFEVVNGAAFTGERDLEATDADEIAELRWVDSTDVVELLPKQIAADFRQGKLPSDVVRYVG